MNIVDERRTTHLFKGVEIGEVFEVDGDFWLKIGEFQTVHDFFYNAVNLYDAHLTHFSLDTNIVPVNATLMLAD